MIIASRTLRVSRNGRRFAAIQVTHQAASGELTVALLTPDAARQITGSGMEDAAAIAFLAQHAIDPPRSASQPHAYAVGDVVQLKSGGHRMTITRLRTSEGTCADPTAGELEEVDVAWSYMCGGTGNSIETDTLDIAVIQIAPALLPHEMEGPF